ncbi:MAG: C4-dicarboxylate TRAP transporter substrate-binding protein [Planctomycetes bacterium]|nr:C4-dicarboxylate TRAP transporter substrate-binding protein [Planctomycetota bacterium]
MSKVLKAMMVCLLTLVSLAAVLPARAGQVEIRVGYENHPGEPVDLFCIEWKRLVEERSKGTMSIQLFPSSQLGSKNDIMDQMIAGDSVITLADGAFFADRGVPDYSITFAPYLFATWDDAWRLFASDWHKEQMDKLEKLGLKVLVWNGIYGVRHTLTTRPVRRVDDLKGMKIRVPNNTMQIVGFDVLGATPTPLPLGEVYTALQQRVIEGVENPLTVLYNGKFHEVAKFLTLDGHIRNNVNWVSGTIFFNSLTPEQQNILIDSGVEANETINIVAEKANEDAIQLFKDAGVEIIEVDVTEFQKAAIGAYTDPRVAARWTPGLGDRVRGIIAGTGK